MKPRDPLAFLFLRLHRLPLFSRGTLFNLEPINRSFSRVQLSEVPFPAHVIQALMPLLAQTASSVPHFWTLVSDSAFWLYGLTFVEPGHSNKGHEDPIEAITFANGRISRINDSKQL